MKITLVVQSNLGIFCILIKGKGTILLDDDTPLHDAYYLEGLTHNIPSVSQICDNSFKVRFTTQGCEISKKSGKTIAVGLRTKGNIYNLHEITNSSKDGHFCFMSQVEESKLWHKRVGHINYDNIVKIIKNQNVKNMPVISKPSRNNCKECHQGKQTKVSFKSKEYSSTKPLQLVHSELCGRTRTNSLNGERYFMLFIMIIPD